MATLSHDSGLQIKHPATEPAGRLQASYLVGRRRRGLPVSAVWVPRLDSRLVDVGRLFTLWGELRTV